MSPSTPSDVTAALLDLQRAGFEFQQTASWRLAAEDGLSAVSIRLLEADLSELMEKARNFDEVLRRFPYSSYVPHWIISGIQRSIARGQHLLDALKAKKACVESQPTTNPRHPKARMGKKKGGAK